MKNILSISFLLLFSIFLSMDLHSQVIVNNATTFIEVNRDSCVYAVSNGKFNGPAEKYKYCTNYKSGTHSWKLYATGNYANGFKNGLWNFTDTSGYKLITTNYVNDTVRGNCTLYYPSSNKIKSSGTIENCLRNGEWKFYDESGNLSGEYHYENGEKKGSFTTYYPNGKIKSKGQYAHVTRKFKIPVEDPKHPGDFSRIHTTMTLTNVPAKTGEWLFYNETGDLINSKKYKNESEIPEYLEPINYKKGYYYRSAILFSGIPDCNYL